MRHRKKKGRLARRTSWRKATLKSLANDLFEYQRIQTTMAKAKALRAFAEPLITLAKTPSNTVDTRRQAFQKLCDKRVVKSLFDEIAPLYKDTPGGYTRIMPHRRRKGDGAQVAIIELVKRTIPDEKLLGSYEKKEKEKRKKEKVEEASDVARKAVLRKEISKPGKEEKAESHVAPEIKPEEKRSVEKIEKEKAKTEQKKATKRSGIFKIFRRKKI